MEQTQAAGCSTPRSLFEGLEERQLLSSVTFSNGVLTLNGDTGITNSLTAYTASNGSLVWGIADNTGRSVSTSQVKSIVVNSGSSADKISIASQISVPVTITGPAAPPSSSSSGSTSFAPSAPAPSSSSSSSVVGKLTGTPFGTSGSWGNYGNTYDKALDGDSSTFFDAPTGDGDYIGLDLGTPATISTFKFIPRSGFSGRMIGGQVQGSNDGVNYTTLGTITSANWPVDNTWNTLTINSGAAYRYVRYLAPSGGYGNVAEIEFDGSVPTTATTTTTTTTLSSGSGTGTSGNSATAPHAVINMVSTNSIIAGQAIDVHAMDSSLGVGTVLTAKYEWNFGDSNGKYNTLIGFNAAHVYDTPGTYTVTLKVTNEAGQVSMSTRQISVSPDNRRTIYVDSVNGNDNNSGLSPDQAIQSTARVNAMLSDNTKVLFKRGQTFNVTNSINPWFANVALGAYGSGANPVLMWTAPVQINSMIISTSSWSTVNLTIDNLTFDSTTATPDYGPDALVAGGKNLMVRNCTFLNLYSAVNTNENPSGILVQDNSAPLDTGLRGYFVWLQGDDSTIIGNTVANSTRQHNIRASFNYTRTLIAYNTLDNKSRQSVDPQDSTKTDINLQLGSYAYVAHNTLYDGALRIGPLGGADEIQVDPSGYMNERTNWVVAEDNTLNNTFVDIAYGAQNGMVRNNVINESDGTEDVNVAGYNSTYNQEVVNFSILNNTGVNTNTQGAFLRLWGAASGLTVANNLFVAPNLHTGPYAAGSIVINNTDTSSFSQISHNVWQMPSIIDQWANGGVNIVNGNYINQSQWNSMANVSGDVFSNVSINSNNAPGASSAAASESMTVAGLFNDFFGNGRPGSGATAGAVQI